MKRAVVVGAGAIGLCCAYALRKRDYEVVVLEAASPGAGASEGNAGWITPSLAMPVPAPGMVGQSVRWMLRRDSPLYIQPTLDPRRLAWLIKLWRNCNVTAYRRGLEATARLGAATFASFDQLERDGIEFEQHRGGLLFCFLQPNKREHVLAELEHMRPFGYSPVALDSRQLHDLEPVASSDIGAGIWIEQERQVRPETLITGLVKWLIDGGVDIRSATSVWGFEHDGGHVKAVCTDEGIVEADEIVLAAGAHTGRISKRLGVKVPIDAGKGYSLHYEPAPIEVRHALYLYEARVGVTPFDRALRLAGTMEFSGINTNLQQTRLEAISGAAQRYLTSFDAVATPRPWAGMRPMTPDGLPVIGKLTANVTVASGHAMLGVTLAPVTGAHVADLIATGRPPEVLRPFDPRRFR